MWATFVQSTLDTLYGLAVERNEMARLVELTSHLTHNPTHFAVIDQVARKLVWAGGYDRNPECEIEILKHSEVLNTFVDDKIVNPESSTFGTSRAIPCGRVTDVAPCRILKTFDSRELSIVGLTSTSETSRASPLDLLSDRELQVAQMLTSGYTALNISANLKVSENTIRTYMRRLYKKLDVNSRADLVRIVSLG